MTSMPKMLGVTAIAAAGLMMTPGQADALTVGTMEGTVGVRAIPFEDGFFFHRIITGQNVFGDEFENTFTFNPAIRDPSDPSEHLFEDTPGQFSLEVDFNRFGPSIIEPVDYDGAGNGVGTGTTVTWALTGNFDEHLNSLFRGDSADISASMVSGGVFTVEGLLQTDGLIHWYSSSGTTDLAAYGLPSEILFRGTFSAAGTGQFGGEDFNLYDADITFSVIPTPAAAAAGLIGFGVLGLRRRQGDDAAV